MKKMNKLLGFPLFIVGVAGVVYYLVIVVISHSPQIGISVVEFFYKVSPELGEHFSTAMWSGLFRLSSPLIMLAVSLVVAWFGHWLMER